MPLSVRADDEVVVCEREFDNGVEAGKTSVTWEHLFDEDAGVARAEEMDKSIPGDGLSAEFGGAFDGVRLCGADALKNGLCLIKICESRVGHFFHR